MILLANFVPTSARHRCANIVSNRRKVVVNDTFLIVCSLGWRSDAGPTLEKGWLIKLLNFKVLFKNSFVITII